MLRLLVLLLILANAVYFAWSRGELAVVGWAPTPQTEPARLAQQIAPQRLRLLSADETQKLSVASASPAEAAAPTECLRLGLFNDNQVQPLQTALQAALPQGVWQWEPGLTPASWVVYMGPLSTPEAMAKKRAELNALNVPFEATANPRLVPGLSLGQYATENAANQALAALGQRGVRTARVVAAQTAQTGQWLRLPRANAAMLAQLAQQTELAAALAGKTPQACP